MGMALCCSSAPADSRWPLQHTGLLARQAGLLRHWPGRVLTVQWLDSAAAVDCGARFAVCFMLVVSYALGAKSSVYDCLMCLCAE